MILWYLLVGHVVGLLGTEHPQASGTWWYVDDSPHLADLYPKALYGVNDLGVGVIWFRGTDAVNRQGS